MSNDKTAEMLRDCYAARQKNDAKAALAFFHPGIRFRIVGSARLKPLTDPITGLDALGHALASMVVEWDWSQFPLKSLVVDGDTAVAHSAGQLKHVPSGTVLQTEILDKLALRDGKIIEFVEFADTEAVARALGLSSS